VHLLVSLHLVGTWVSIDRGILVTLSGCRHLDCLEIAEEYGKSGVYSWPPPGDL
jgi:hypothetical protein